MTVENGTLSVSYAGNGVQTSFPITFEFILSAQVRVTTTIGSTTSLLTPGVHYSISGSTLTMFFAPGVGTTLKIQRATTIRQMTDLRQQGQYHPETLERMADLLTMICQELAAGVIEASDVIGMGEVNDGENVNDVGVGVYEGKSGTTLQFRGVAAGSAKIAVTHDDATETIMVDLGSVGPSDVGAAPASLSTTVTSHGTRITKLEARPAVSARGEYTWDGSKYVLESAIDPDEILPDTATAPGAGVAEIAFKASLPTEKYRVACLTSTSVADHPARACWDMPKTADQLTLLFTRGAEDVAEHVYGFSLFIDYGEA